MTPVPVKSPAGSPTWIELLFIGLRRITPVPGNRSETRKQEVILGPRVNNVPKCGP